jgi:HSP20 family molecular chaperone IbpA
MAETKRKERRSLFDLLGEYMEELEALSDELGEVAWAEHPSWDLRLCCLEPLCNVSVTADEVVVTADLPNTDPATIKVEQINQSTLEIKAEMRRKIRFNELGITHHQGEFQYFRCLTRIPVPIDAKQMKTKFKRGFLEVHLPRKKSQKRKVAGAIEQAGKRVYSSP